MIKGLAFKYCRVYLGLDFKLSDTNLRTEVIEDSKLKVEVIVLAAVLLISSVQLS